MICNKEMVLLLFCHSLVTQDGFVAQELGEIFPDILQPTAHIVQSDNVSYDGKTYNQKITLVK